MTALPTAATVTLGAQTITIPVEYGTAIREGGGEPWDQEPLWRGYPGAPSGAADQAWARAQEHFAEEQAAMDPSDREGIELVLVWRIAADVAASWTPFN